MQYSSVFLGRTLSCPHSIIKQQSPGGVWRKLYNKIWNYYKKLHRLGVIKFLKSQMPYCIFISPLIHVRDVKLKVSWRIFHYMVNLVHSDITHEETSVDFSFYPYFLNLLLLFSLSLFLYWKSVSHVFLSVATGVSSPSFVSFCELPFAFISKYLRLYFSSCFVSHVNYSYFFCLSPTYSHTLRSFF